MKRLQTTIKKIMQISNPVSVFSLIVAVVVLLQSKKTEDAFSILAIAVFALIALFALVLLTLEIVVFIRSISRIRFYLNWDNVPKRFRVEGTLSDCIKERGTLEILARTGLRWFIGGENKLERDIYDSATDRERLQLQGLITEAVNAGAKIKFYLQNPYITMPSFNDEQKEKLKKHFELTIESYNQIKASYQISRPDNLSIYMVNKRVDNSMVRFMAGDRIKHFIYDLGISFKASREKKGLINKPFIIALNPKEDMKDFVAEFEHEIDTAVPLSVFDKDKARAAEEYSNIMKSYEYFSEQRQDKSSNLIHTYVKQYIDTDHSSEMAPPICVQLLVTNRCSNSCKMCNHYRLYNHKTQKKEMTNEEICCVLDQLKIVGTKSIIISGGEPLCRDNIFDLLDYASKRLSVGLLTNGVKAGGQPINATEAKRMASSCKWVQVSLDSLNPQTYKEVRGSETMEAAITSIKHLAAAGVPIEVSMTLQHDNIVEAPSFQETFRTSVCANVPIRFKFAHGPDKGNNFLPTQQQLENLIKSIHDAKGTNYNYLITMLHRGYFDLKSMPQGEPVRQKMDEFRRQGYKCHVLKMMCKIDPTGVVYPCCFLFDDNSYRSIIREQFNLGSLRDSHTQRVLSSPEKFREIWNSEKRKALLTQTLPMHENACFYCTRHFYQNELLNRVENVIEKYRVCDLKNYILEKTAASADEVFWM